MRIQHNILAMNAYRNYNTNTSALSKNLEKLSSGYKINRAGDDAAGLAISEKMRAQITGLNAAQKNVKDGISLVKTAEGAMQEIQDMLNRMDYLATQSANGTYDDPVDRKNLQKEVDQLRTEINRIADSANFNGIKLLDGSMETGGTAAGQPVDAKISLDTTCAIGGQVHKEGVSSQAASFEINLKEAFSVANVKAGNTLSSGSQITLTVNIGGQTFTVKATYTGATLSAGMAINVDNLSFSATQTSISLTAANGSSYKLTFDSTNLTSGVLKFEKAASQAALDFDAAVGVSITADKADFPLKTTGSNNSSYDCYTQNVINGYAQKGSQLAHAHLEITDDIVNALINEGSLKIDTATITFDLEQENTVSNGVIGVKDLLNDEGKIDTTDAAKMKELLSRMSQAAYGNDAFHVGVDTAKNALTLQEKFGYYSSSSPDEDLLDTEEKIQAKISCTGASTGGGALSLQIGDTSDKFNQLEVSIGNMHTSSMKSATTGKTIADIKIDTQAGAQAAIQTIRDAINYVSEVRGDLGATQNRLEHTANNLSVMAENIQDAESTIRDTDIAEEMMAYTKNNILVQSAQAMLAQANAVPQGVLQLLG